MIDGDGEKTVLLVEDEAILALSEAKILAKNGYKVITAYSGAKAVDAVERSPEISLVLMDINLGDGIDGTQAAAMILERRDLPLIFLSSHTESEVVRKTEGITSCGYIVKNSGEMVLVASMKMAFRLYDARVKEREKDRALIESERRYRDLFENATLAIFQSALEGKVLAVNPMFAAMFGYDSPDEVYASVNDVGTDIFADPLRRLEIIRLRAANPQLRSFDNLYRRKDGSTFLGRLNLRSVADAQGRIEYFEGFIEDISERSRTEDELARVKTMLEAAFEQTPIPMVLASMPDAVLRFANPASLDFLGAGDEPTPIGLRLSDFGTTYKDYDAAGKATPLSDAPLALALRGVRTLNQERRIVRKDGTTRWALVSGTPIYDERGDIIAAYITFPDITERKKAEEALRQSERSLSSIYDAVADVLYHLSVEADGRYRFLSVNPAFCLVTGLSEDRVVGRTVDEVIPESSLGMVLRKYRQAIETKAAVRWEEISEYPGGKLIGDVSITPVFDDGRCTNLVGSVHDRTAVKRAEDESRDFSRRIGEILESISDAFFALDEDFVVTYFNAAAERLLNRKVGEVLGRALFDAFPEARGSVFEENYALALREKRAMAFEVNFGVAPYVNWYDVRVYPQEKGISVYFQVITERKRAEEALARALGEKDTLFRELQHRVKNTLAMIDSLVSLESQQTAAPEAHAALENLHSRIGIIATLYTMLYADGESGGIRLDDYLSKLATSLVEAFADEGGRVALRLDLDELTAEAKSASAFGLILNELITNALKYAFPGGRDGVVSVRLKREGELAVLEVADDGVALPEGFDPARSTGLGFKLVDMLAKQLGGEIYFEQSQTKRFGIRTGAMPK